MRSSMVLLLQTTGPGKASDPGAGHLCALDGRGLR